MYISTILLGSSVVDTLAEASNDYDVEGRENLNNVVASGRSRELSLYHKSPDGGNPSHTYSQYSPKGHLGRPSEALTSEAVYI